MNSTPELGVLQMKTKLPKLYFICKILNMNKHIFQKQSERSIVLSISKSKTGNDRNKNLKQLCC